MPEIRKGTIYVAGDDGVWTPVGDVKITSISTVSGDVISTTAPLRGGWITGTVSEQIDDDWAWWAIQRALQRYRQ